MTDYKSDLLTLLNDRGYIHQLTDAEGLDSLASKQVAPGCIGFDMTADSLHVGNLVSIMLLRRLQQAGHKPIVVIGGGTIYQSFLDMAHTLYLTFIDLDVEGDTQFPDYNAAAKWNEIQREAFSPDEKNKHAYSFVTLERA